MISKKQKENEFRLELIFGLTIFYPLPVCLTFPLLMQKGTRPHYNIYAFYNAITSHYSRQCFSGFQYEIPFALYHRLHIPEKVLHFGSSRRGSLLLLDDHPQFTAWHQLGKSSFVNGKYRLFSCPDRRIRNNRPKPISGY